MLKDKNVIRAKGEIRDRAYVDEELVEDTGFRENVIVSDVNKLISALFSEQEGETFRGLSYWAVGEGDAGWNISAPPSASSVDSDLVNEIGRIAIDSSNFEYLDADNNVVSEITNKLQLTAVFDTGDCNGAWLEMGIYGGDADLTLDSGILVNHLTHPIIEKRDNMTVERTLRFTFE
jgi:hypothetical protein